MVNHQPLVSVIMNCFNGEKYLQEAIESVYQQTYQNWEIIFFDNASTDKSAEIANSYSSKLKYIRHETTISLGAARNKALSYCNSEFIAFLDVDDVWDKLFLITAIKYLQNNEFFMFCSNALSIDENGNTNGILFKNIKHKIVIGNRDNLIREYNVCFSSTLMRVKKKNKFIDHYSIIEDFAFIFDSIGEKKYIFLNTSLAKYRKHNNNLSLSDPKMEIQELKDYYKRRNHYQSLKFNRYFIERNEIIEGKYYARQRNIKFFKHVFKLFYLKSYKGVFKIMLLILPSNILTMSHKEKINK